MLLKKEFIDVCFQFFGASQSTLFQLQMDTRPEELTHVQYSILEYLFFAGDKSLSEIRACMYLAMPNASREVKKLYEKGFVIKINNEQDKRKSTIQISPPGRVVMEQAFGVITKNANQMFGQLNEVEQIEIMEHFQYLIDHFFQSEG